MRTARTDKNAKASHEAMRAGAERGLVKALNRHYPDRMWRFRTAGQEGEKGRRRDSR
jgi:hypothetical protein